MNALKKTAVVLLDLDSDEIRLCCACTMDIRKIVIRAIFIKLIPIKTSPLFLVKTLSTISSLKIYTFCVVD